MKPYCSKASVCLIGFLTLVVHSVLAGGRTNQLAEHANLARPAKAGTKAHVYPTFGSIERLDPALDALIPAGAKIEKLAGGFTWFITALGASVVLFTRRMSSSPGRAAMCAAPSFYATI